MFYLSVVKCTREEKPVKLGTQVCGEKLCAEENNCSFVDSSGQLSTWNPSSEVDVEIQEEIEQPENYKVCLNYVVDDNLFVIERYEVIIIGNKK